MCRLCSKAELVMEAILLEQGNDWHKWDVGNQGKCCGPGTAATKQEGLRKKQAHVGHEEQANVGHEEEDVAEDKTEAQGEKRGASGSAQKGVGHKEEDDEYKEKAGSGNGRGNMSMCRLCSKAELVMEAILLEQGNDWHKWDVGNQGKCCGPGTAATKQEGLRK